MFAIQKLIYSVSQKIKMREALSIVNSGTGEPCKRINKPTQPWTMFILVCISLKSTSFLMTRIKQCFIFLF